MPEFSRTVMAISSDMIATAPIPEQLEEIGWTRNECISDSQMMIHYYRKTCDGRIAFGKGGWGIALGGNIGKSFDRSKRRAEDVARNFRRIYPMLADAKITHDWSGAIDRTVIDGASAERRLQGVCRAPPIPGRLTETRLGDLDVRPDSYGAFAHTALPAAGSRF
jgi:glycine/D-amino acid oxidase-like deaminating enzyme